MGSEAMHLANATATTAFILCKKTAVVPAAYADANHLASVDVTLEGGVTRASHTGHAHSALNDKCRLLWLLVQLRLRHHVA